MNSFSGIAIPEKNIETYSTKIQTSPHQPVNPKNLEIPTIALPASNLPEKVISTDSLITKLSITPPKNSPPQQADISAPYKLLLSTQVAASNLYFYR